MVYDNLALESSGDVYDLRDNLGPWEIFAHAWLPPVKFWISKEICILFLETRTLE